MSSAKTILITGGSGLTASRCILEAFNRGLRIKTTVRSPRAIDETRRILHNGGASQQQISSITFVPYNELFTAEDCADAVIGCDFIIHIIPYGAWNIKYVEHHDSICLAKDPVLKLLKAAKLCNPGCRVVIFNSFWAVKGNKPSLGKGQHYTEADWSPVYSLEDPSANIFTRLRNLIVIAERAIRGWLASVEVKGFHVSVINPVSTVGPILDGAQADSQNLITKLLDSEVKQGPDYALGVVDSRDLADLAFLCLDNASAAGERYIACTDGGLIGIKGSMKILNRLMSDAQGKNVSYDAWAPWVLKVLTFGGVVDAELARDMSKSNKASNQKAKELGWRPRGAEECIEAALGDCRREKMRRIGWMQTAIIREKG